MRRTDVLCQTDTMNRPISPSSPCLNPRLWGWWPSPPPHSSSAATAAALPPRCASVEPHWQKPNLTIFGALGFFAAGVSIGNLLAFGDSHSLSRSASKSAGGRGGRALTTAVGWWRRRRNMSSRTSSWRKSRRGTASRPRAHLPGTERSKCPLHLRHPIGRQTNLAGAAKACGSGGAQTTGLLNSAWTWAGHGSRANRPCARAGWAA